MEGVGRALLFKKVNDEGEYHNYFIQTSLLSTNNTLSLSLSLSFKSHILVLNMQGILDFHYQHVDIFIFHVCCSWTILGSDGKVSQYEL
jgi:hypothetical protein